MGIGSIVNLASGYLQSLITGGSANSSSQSSIAPTGNGTGANTSPFARILSSLQQLQQSNPSQYTQVTQQISTSLQTTANSATAAGNTGFASEVSQLSTDFQKASTSGQLPNVQDLARAIGVGHHRLAGLSSVSNLIPSSSAGASNPLSIIENSLSSAAIRIR